jgi:GNAT superfamily N-acetyltransferase
MLSPSGAAWVAEREGAVVGHVMWAWVEGSALPTAELAVVVAEAEQRRRLGLRMMNLAAEDAYAAGAVQLLLVVSAANDPVIRMIRSHVPGTRVERDGPNLNFFAPATRLAADELQV